MATNNTINNELSYLQLPQNGFAPSPVTGGVLAVSAGDRLYYNDATATYGLPLLTNGGGGLSEGDLLLGNAAGYCDLLNIGTATYVLTSDGTTAAWAAPGAEPGLATFLCQTPTNLPANGVDISNPASLATFGTTQADLATLSSEYWSGYSNTIFTNSSSSFGGAYPLAILVDGSGGPNFDYASYTGSSIYGPAIGLHGSRGSMASPSPNLLNDILSRFYVTGQTGTGTEAGSECANIRFVAEDNFATNPACGIHFFTQATAAGGLISRAKIDKTGLLTASFGINTTSLAMAATKVGTATIAASTTAITVNTAGAITGAKIFATIAGFTGTASLALGSVSVGNIVNGVSFDITIATIVPITSTVLVNWFIINP